MKTVLQYRYASMFIPPRKVIISLCLIMGALLGGRAGSLAQDNPPIIRVVSLDSQVFPEVVVAVAVADENGPRDGLTAANFQVFEDGMAVPETAITVSPDTDQPLSLVLAVDLSIKEGELEQFNAFKAGAKTLIDTLGPADQVGVITFYNEVKPDTLEFITDKARLKSDIEALTPTGNRTDFNQAVLKAVTSLETNSTGRKAVVMLTNSGNNVNTLSTDKVINQVRGSQTAIYSLSLAGAEALASISTATGGQALNVVPNTEEIQASLQTIGRLLRQGGYQLTFESNLPADDAEHALIVGLTYEGRTGQAEGGFVARPGPVTVEVLDLVEGQTVAGPVNLAVETTAPADIATVTYRLDGELLAEVTTPPFGLAWDSAVHEPGPHHLTVIAVDRAGNWDQTELNLQIARPLQVTLEASPASLAPGGQMTVGAAVEAVAEVTQVVLLLDGREIDRDEAPPYAFTIDNDGLAAGQHRLTIRARDSQGHQAEAEMTVEFLAPMPTSTPAPPPKPATPWRKVITEGWSPLLLITSGVTAILSFIGLALLGLLFLIAWQKRSRRQSYRLEIANLGNIGDQYELRAADPMGALQFQFSLNGVSLPERFIPQATEESPEPLVTAAAPEPAGTPPSPPPPSRPAAGGVGQAAGQALRTGGAAADIASSVGALLPRAVGAPVQRLSGQLRRTQSNVNRATRLPGQVSRAWPAGAQTQPAGPQTRPAQPPVRAKPPAGQQRPILTGETWAQTPFLERGETLLLDLHITAANPYRSQVYAFKVMSRAAGQAEPALMVEQGQVQIEGLFWWGRLWPYLAFAVIVGGLLTTALYLMVVLGMLEGGRLVLQ